jgi:hypothetical protein
MHGFTRQTIKLHPVMADHRMNLPPHYIALQQRPSSGALLFPGLIVDWDMAYFVG